MKVIFVLLLILFYKMGLSQSFAKQFILEHTTPISSIHPDDTSFSDLEAIRTAIGSKRIVMLGELYHGDGTTFQAKTRLIKFLHQKMGFNVLVFESDFFSLNHGWEAFKKGNISLDSLAYLSIYPLWTRCRQFQPLLSYIHQTGSSHPLILSGMDNRGYTGYGIRYLYKEVDSFLKKTAIPFVNNETAYSEYCNLLQQAPALVEGKNRQDMDKLMGYTQHILTQLHTAGIKDNFHSKILEGQLQLFHMAVYYKYDSTYALTQKNYPLHDFQMADNLKWLASLKFAQEKIIVWAHNTHIEKASEKNIRHTDYKSMGYYFTQDSSILQQTYIIGFTSYSGGGKLMLGSHPGQKVSTPHKNSLESWMHQIGYPYSFVDFTRLNHPDITIGPFYMKTYINAEEKLEWSKYYDGIFFIDRMRPCGAIN